MNRFPLPSLLSLIGWLLVVSAVALFGSTFDPGAWYASLLKPAWTPPNWVFGPVWSVHYVMMAIAAWLAARRPDSRSAINLFLCQLIVNGLWSWIFFGEQQILLGLIDILLLLFLITLTARHFFALDRRAGYLLLPYLLWVGYATTLNAGIFFLN